MMNIVLIESFKVDVKKTGKENICFALVILFIIKTTVLRAWPGQCIVAVEDRWLTGRQMRNRLCCS